MLVLVQDFYGGKKTKTRRKPSEQIENKQQPLPTYDRGPESNPGHIGGRQELSLLRHPCSQSLLLGPNVNLKRDMKLPSEVSEQIPDTVRNFPSVQLHSSSWARARQEYMQP